MDQKTIGVVLGRSYLVVSGLIMIIENLRKPQEVAFITVPFAILFILTGVLTLKWLRLMSICCAIFALILSVFALSSSLFLRGLIMIMLFYLIPLLILINPIVKERYR